ncbi:PKD domain-containing protein [Candidatus Bathyarchaeota archaeon]|nr:MAG: PKD domain-containing protein [Candidatus Bathyarchaeota archaeon]
MYYIRRLSIIFITGLMFVFSSLVYSSVVSVTILPNEPVQGDIISLEVNAKPNIVQKLALEYGNYVKVDKGEFSWALGTVEIPGSPNNFTITANGVKRLRVTVNMMGVPVTVSSLGVDGIAVISQRNVENGLYWVEVSGVPLDDASLVHVSIKAETRIVTDTNGRYFSQYNSSYFPPGVFQINVGDNRNEVLLRQRVGWVNQPPKPVIDHTDIQLVDRAISFSAAESYDNDGVIVEYKWDFGDGEKADGLNVRHRYTIPGEYLVQLLLVDNNGDHSILNERLLVTSSWVNLLVLPENIPSTTLVNIPTVLRYSVINMGKNDIHSLEVLALIDDQPYTMQTIDLEANQSMTVNIYWTPESTGFHRTELHVDPANQIHENFEHDNSYVYIIRVDNLIRQYMGFLAVTLVLTAGLFYFLLKKIIK